MDHPWTSTSKHPSKLYRVIHPHSHTPYNPRTGFDSSLPDTLENYIPFTSLPTFQSSLLNHLSQVPTPSPYISTFSSLEEAESWAIAAEDVFGSECWVVLIDVENVAMRGVKVWSVKDLKEGLKGFGVDLGVGDEGGGRSMSEWLVLYHVPGVAVRVLKGSRAIRVERGWVDDNLDAAYTGDVLVEDYKALEYNGDLYLDPLKWIRWEKCDCASEEACTEHAGPYYNPMKASSR